MSLSLWGRPFKAAAGLLPGGVRKKTRRIAPNSNYFAHPTSAGRAPPAASKTYGIVSTAGFSSTLATRRAMRDSLERPTLTERRL